MADHVHLICIHCSTITEAPLAEFDELTAGLQERFGFTPRPRHYARGRVLGMRSLRRSLTDQARSCDGNDTVCYHLGTTREPRIPMSDPLWKKAYDAAEKQTGPALTKLLANPDVVEAVTLGMAVRKRALDDLGRFMRRNLHTVNLPSGTDVQKVSNQIAGLERQIRLLDRRIDELTADKNDE